MKNFSIISQIALGSLFLLIGCNSSNETDQTEVKSAVYMAVSKDDNGNLIEVQVISEATQNPVLTFWDDRDHQVTYPGNRKNSGEIEFSAIQYSCTPSGLNLQCGTPVGEILLKQKTLDIQKLSDYQGQYQALWNNSLYTMMVTNEGKVEIQGSSCTSSGLFSQSNDVEHLIDFDIIEDNCGMQALRAYSTLYIDNNELYSIELLNSNQDFPSIWIKTGS